MEKYQNGTDATVAFNLLKEFCKGLGIDIEDIAVNSTWNSNLDFTTYITSLESTGLNGEITPTQFNKLENFLTELESNGYAEYHRLSTANYTLIIELNGGY